MNIHPYTWIITIVVLTGVLVFDAVIMGRRPHVPTTRECVKFLGVFVGAALLFGLGIWFFSGGRYAQEFYAGWLTEYSLSMDNLFIFLIIMEKQRVPRELQQFALMVGIMIGLILRGIFIGVGAVLIQQLAWIFFIFGFYLLYTAWGVLKDFRTGADEDEHAGEGRVMAWIKAHTPTTNTWEGDRIIVRHDGRVRFTLIFFTILTLGSTDLMFALDSIPAIFGLTNEAFIVFTANVFALMGLRQLYFLLGDLLEKLYYLPVGLFVLLGYIGAKLVLHAMNHYGYDQRLGLVGTLLTLVVAALAVLLCWGAARLALRLLGRGRGEAGLGHLGRVLTWLVCGALALGLAVLGAMQVLRWMDGLGGRAKLSFSGEIPTMVSLGVIVVTLGTTAAVSILKSKRDLAKVVANLD